MAADKAFHVSPFMGLDGRYRFELDAAPAELVAVRIDEERDGRRLLPGSARRPAGRARRASLAHVLARRPLMTFQVSALIRWQALRLSAKRVPVHRKPPYVPVEAVALSRPPIV